MLNIANTKSIILTKEQWEAIDVVNDLMLDLKTAYPMETVDYLINPATGEIVEAMAFGRIRGILDFIATQPFKPVLK